VSVRKFVIKVTMSKGVLVNRRRFLKDAVQSDLRMCTKEPSFYLPNSLFRFLFHFMFLQSLIVVSL
jgi:hypothetical protein